MIPIIDCGSQYTQNIARRVREQGVYTEILPFKTDPSVILKLAKHGLIISGGQYSVYDDGAPMYSKTLLQAGVPVLGICYGQQSMAHLLEGLVQSANTREYGKTGIRIVAESQLFAGVPREFISWMSHGDIVINPPSGFIVTAYTQNGHIAAMEKGNLYAVQFHPEVDHTEHGRKILDNFLTICMVPRTWDPEHNVDQMIANLRKELSGQRLSAAISGGVDSSTAAVLVHRAIGDNLKCYFVDNGLMRKYEVQEVTEAFAKAGIMVTTIDASERFLHALKGVTDPMLKRKTIGSLFINVFEEAAIQGGFLDGLVQGTSYPDVIESIALYGASSVIKLHHNVGGLPKTTLFKRYVEPLRLLFKDEIRRIAEKLDLPPEIVLRKPFPGPGLAIRVLGEVTKEKVAMAREADWIYREELKKRGLDVLTDQDGVVLTNQSVGVMGDAGTYEYVAAMWSKKSRDFMTADAVDFPAGVTKEIGARIVSEVRGINRAVYDVSSKPPSTIEWE